MLFNNTRDIKLQSSLAGKVCGLGLTWSVVLDLVHIGGGMEERAHSKHTFHLCLWVQIISHIHQLRSN